MTTITESKSSSTIKGSHSPDSIQEVLNLVIKTQSTRFTDYIEALCPSQEELEPFKGCVLVQLEDDISRHTVQLYFLVNKDDFKLLTSHDAPRFKWLSSERKTFNELLANKYSDIYTIHYIVNTLGLEANNILNEECFAEYLNVIKRSSVYFFGAKKDIFVTHLSVFF